MIFTSPFQHASLHGKRGEALNPVILLHVSTYESRMCAGARESLQRDRPGGLTSPALHANGSANPLCACWCHGNQKQTVSAHTLRRARDNTHSHVSSSRAKARITLWHLNISASKCVTRATSASLPMPAAARLPRLPTAYTSKDRRVSVMAPLSATAPTKAPQIQLILEEPTSW